MQHRSPQSPGPHLPRGDLRKEESEMTVSVLPLARQSWYKGNCRDAFVDGIVLVLFRFCAQCGFSLDYGRCNRPAEANSRIKMTRSVVQRDYS
jgi:hypothetical protein